MKRDENTEWYISHVLNYGTDRTQNIPVGEYLDWWAYRHIDEELVALGYPEEADDWTDADWDKPTILRCSIVGASTPSEIIGQSITGEISDATAL